MEGDSVIRIACIAKCQQIVIGNKWCTSRFTGRVSLVTSCQPRVKACKGILVSILGLPVVNAF